MIGSLKRLVKRTDDLEAAEIQTPVWLSAPLTSTAWDGDAYSTTAKTLIDLSAVFSVPAYSKAVLVRVRVNDSGSAGVTTFQGLILGPANTADVGLRFNCDDATNDAVSEGIGIIPCDSNGDVYYQTVASGAGTLDIVIQVWGYWL